jgi:hypothetical protein
MLLASTGQPSFYPQDFNEDEYDNLKSKNDKDNNRDNISDNKDNTSEDKSIEDNNNEEDEKEEKIFDFH